MPCPSCGSTNTTRDRFARKGPSIVILLLFGWFFLLIGFAFSKRTDLCRDCGELNRYRSRGSWIAMLVLLLLVFLVVFGLMLEQNQ
jgi:MFS family permease